MAGPGKQQQDAMEIVRNALADFLGVPPKEVEFVVDFYHDSGNLAEEDGITVHCGTTMHPESLPNWHALRHNDWVERLNGGEPLDPIQIN